MPATLTYPGTAPGNTRSFIDSDTVVLENAALRCEFSVADETLETLAVTNHHTGEMLAFGSRLLPAITLKGSGKASFSLCEPVRVDGDMVAESFVDESAGLRMVWTARLNDDDNAVVISVELTATADLEVSEVCFMDEPMPGARPVGEVSGSVIVCGNAFLGIENPLADNCVSESQVSSKLSVERSFCSGDTWTHSFAVGVMPLGQFRRGFAYYLDRRRIYPYRQFLHYNNWYDVILARQTERMTEQEALDAIEYYGRELVETRGVTVDAVVWDDGWDDFDTLWDFHNGFPNGFRNLIAAASKYGIDQGVWMSPNGGYATAKAKRIAYGQPLGYETNERGYSMAGPNYRKAFRDACVKMIRDNGVVFFKFDGMGEGGSGKHTTDGTKGTLSNDVQAIIELSKDLHREKEDVYVSMTAGTWASPYWLLYGDNVWRQGADSGHLGKGDTRQQWITYRDAFTHERVVEAGPLYPLNSLMLHGILIGNREGRAPAGMVLDEASVADEVWSFFASGTCLQELYVSPGVPTDAMLDTLAAAAKWARSNEAVLIDTHWIGGSPGDGEVYGWASWQPGKGIIGLRNPAERVQTFGFNLKYALELPDDVDDPMAATAIYPQTQDMPDEPIDVLHIIEMELQPFETIVFELT